VASRTSFWRVTGAGAIVVNEFDALSSKKRAGFFFAPAQDRPVGSKRAPQALEGALGVAPKIYELGEDFPNAFSERWQGERTARRRLLLLRRHGSVGGGAGQVDHRGGEEPDLSKAMLDAAAPPGEGIRWDELEIGLKRLRKGEDLYYSGLTGRSRSTAAARAAPYHLQLTVQQGVIVDLAE